MRRLEALEARVNEALQAGQGQGGFQQAPEGEWPDQKESTRLDEDASFAEKAADKAADVMEDAAADAVQKLHPALIKFLNRWAQGHRDPPPWGAARSLGLSQCDTCCIDLRNWGPPSSKSVERSDAQDRIAD